MQHPEKCGLLKFREDGAERYATPILYASEAATMPVQRRVLQLDFAAEDLPGGLQWLGV